MRLVHCLIASLLLAVLPGCTRSAADPPLLGTLEWDRIGIGAEASEPIVAIAVREGDTVESGQLILELDPRRADAQLAQAQAEQRRAQAALMELSHGARQETVAAARAEVARAEAGRANAQRERERAAELRQRGLVAQAELDRSDAALKTARAEVSAASARVLELTNGTRPEQIDQAEASLAIAGSHVDEMTLARQRLTVRATQAGRVDALPFKLGDQPAKGATVVSLLSGSAPYARVFVPAPRRAALQTGQRFQIQVAGVAQPLAATLRAVRSEAAFTPYYALSGDDAQRLSFRAELVLEGTGVERLPAGLPLTAEPLRHDQ